ncbi:hypothetical protein HK102_005477 [Quaeritorhiza haematococci]|nr:hypothetical protein HK102_005477 [Quaeritorhiza haematococci]
MAQSKTDADIELRGVATDTVSAICEAVGKDLFRAEFAPYLEAIVPQLLNSCNLKEKGYAELLQEAELKLDDGEDDDSDDDDDDLILSANSSIAREKETAIDCLADIFFATRTHFLPFVQPTVDAILSLIDHDNEGVRISCISALYTVMHTFWRISLGEAGAAEAEKKRAWEAGLPLKVPLHGNVAQMIELVMKTTFELLKDEDDKTVVMQICQDLSESIKMIGPAMLVNDTPKVVSFIKEILTQKHLCQQDGIDDDEDTDLTQSNGAKPPSSANPGGAHAKYLEDLDEDLSELSTTLILAASDIIGAIASALGPAFAPIFASELMPGLVAYAKPSRTRGEKSMVVGCLGEVVEGVKEGITPFTEAIMSVVVGGLRDEAEEVRSNSAYAVGLLCEHTGMDLTSHYLQLLQLLHPLFSESSATNATDNAAGAVSRMIMRAQLQQQQTGGSGELAIPLDHVLPVLLRFLPLKQDYQENEPVFRCLMGLLRAGNGFLMNEMPRLMQIFAQVLSPPEGQLSAERRADVIEFLNSLKVHHTQSLQTVLSSLDAASQQVIMSVLQ